MRDKCRDINWKWLLIFRIIFISRKSIQVLLTLVLIRVFNFWKLNISTILKIKMLNIKIRINRQCFFYHKKCRKILICFEIKERERENCTLSLPNNKSNAQILTVSGLN